MGCPGDGPARGLAERVECCRHNVSDHESMTSLAGVIAQLDGLASDAVIFAQPPWRRDTRALVVAVDDVESMDEQEGLINFFDVDLAHEVRRERAASGHSVTGRSHSPARRSRPRCRRRIASHQATSFERMP